MLTGAPQQGLTPEQAAARINELKKALNQRLENKSAANEGNSICLRKALRFSDLGATNTLNHEQWVQAFVRLGAQFSEAVRAHAQRFMRARHVGTEQAD